MRNSIIFITILFFATIFQSAVIESFFYPIFLIPLALIIGSLLFHFLPVYYGFIWFTFLPIFTNVFTNDQLPIITYPIIAIAGYFMMLRWFTRHSMLGMFGLALSLFILQTVIFAICNYNWHANYSFATSFIWSALLGAVLLFVGYAVMQKIITNKRMYIIGLHDRI